LGRPVEGHSGCPGKHSRRAPKHFRGAPLGRKFLDFFSKWCILYFIFLSDVGAPERRGPGVVYPLPRPIDGPALGYYDRIRTELKQFVFDLMHVCVVFYDLALNSMIFFHIFCSLHHVSVHRGLNQVFESHIEKRTDLREVSKNILHYFSITLLVL